MPNYEVRVQGTDQDILSRQNLRRAKIHIYIFHVFWMVNKKGRTNSKPTGGGGGEFWFCYKCFFFILGWDRVYLQDDPYSLPDLFMKVITADQARIIGQVFTYK